MAGALADAGETSRAVAVAGLAEEAARSIDRPDRRARALGVVAGALADAGQTRRAEDVARSIDRPDRRAEALVAVAGHVEPAHVRRLVAEAFHVGDWTVALGALAGVEPGSVSVVADEYLGLGRQHRGHGAGTSGRVRRSGPRADGAWS